jgi:mannosylglycerate hydrolase
VVAWNSLPQGRTEIAELVLDLPREMNAADFRIVTADGAEVPLQQIESADRYTVIQSPNDCADMMAMRRHRCFAELAELPGSGYKTFFVRPLAKKARSLTRSIGGRVNAMENEFLIVEIQPNGTLAVTDKPSGRRWTDLGYFRDCSEIGNPWEHVGVPHDEVLTTLTENARIARVLDGELVTRYRIEIDWELPRSRSADEKTRSAGRVAYRIVNTVTLRKGQPWVEIETTVENTARDHYLQVSFPTKIESNKTFAATPFDVVERGIELPDPAKYDEDLQTEQPMDRFVTIGDGKFGVALLNEGLKAYEPHGDSDQTLSLTLLRCFPLRICITNLEMTDYSSLDDGSQCLGTQRFRYAFMPFSGTVGTAGIWQAADRFSHAVRAAQIAPATGGSMPLELSFLEVENPALHVSAVKQSENGAGWVIRLFNPTDTTLGGTIRLNRGMMPPAPQSPVERQAVAGALPAATGNAWGIARLVDLEENEIETLDIDPNGGVRIDVTPKKIVTVEFGP